MSAAQVACSLIAAAQEGPHICREHEDCLEHPELAAACSRRAPSWALTAEAVLALPWGIVPGTYGRVRITDRAHAIGSRLRTRRLLLDGVAVAEVIYRWCDGERISSLTVLDETEERAHRDRARQANRAHARALEAARIEVERDLLAGRAVMFFDGQRGGVFTAKRGGTHVPANSMLLYLGARLDPGVRYGVWEEVILDGTVIRPAADLEAEAVEDEIADAWEEAS